MTRSVLVTGGSRGIGEGIVRGLADNSVRVGCGYVRSEAAAGQLAEEYPGLVHPVRYELGDASSAEAAVANCISEFGGLDGVIANAGVWAGGLLSRLDAAEWSRVVSTNLDGVAQICRAALPHLVESAGGSITIVSSVVGIAGGAGDTAYASAKAGLIGFARSLAKEVARDGVRVNVLAPGFVQTDMTAQVPENSLERIQRDTLLGRAGTVEEIAAAAIYLSEDATFCTGSVLTVDGGWSV